MLENLTKKQKIIFFIIFGIMSIVIIYYFYSSLYTDNFAISYEDLISKNNFIIDSSNTEIYSNNLTNVVSQSNSIVVYICGAVKNTKVVTLKENSRICDAIDAVGGLTNDADLTNINLAYPLEDGEKIYIPKKGELLEEEHILSSTPQSYSTYFNTSSNKKININSATQTELETLPGIGPSTALKILEHKKNNGNFSSIEDIKDIPGIGESKYESIKDYIKVK